MAKLIDLDALGIGKCNPDVFNDKGYAKGWNSAIEILQNAPTLDAVAVVRCRDCKWWVREGNDSYGYAMFCDHDCSLGGQGIKKPEDYCSYGERKGGDE